ncbi:MAG TPA: hypothetical protein VOA87_23115 [Thermoanaerobaculia bacterium]|nr:hypothetical protein [Thermoanaerobaculia bacterium]
MGYLSPAKYEKRQQKAGPARCSPPASSSTRRGARRPFARRCGARFVVADRLCGFARFFADCEGAGNADGRTLVEACADGWWYTTGLPGGRRVAACLSDADLARRLRLSDAGEWSRRLAATSHVGAALRGARALGPLTVCAASSRRLDSAAGSGWLAVGDAASTFDPLSSAGIVKALRSGIFASYAIADLLAKGDERALERYRSFVREEFAGYARVRDRHYATERRWPESEFWRRRLEA